MKVVVHPNRNNNYLEWIEHVAGNVQIREARVGGAKTFHQGTVIILKES